MDHSFLVRTNPVPGEIGATVSLDESHLPVSLSATMCQAVRRRLMEAMMIGRASECLSPLGGALAVVGVTMIAANGLGKSVAPIAAGIGTIGAEFLGNMITVRHLRKYADHHPWETAVTFHEASDAFEQGSGDAPDLRIQRFQMFLNSVSPGIRRSLGWLFSRYTKSSTSRQLLCDLHTICQSTCPALARVEDDLKQIARDAMHRDQESSELRTRQSRELIRRLSRQNHAQTRHIQALRQAKDEAERRNEEQDAMMQSLLERVRHIEASVALAHEDAEAYYG